MIWNWVLIIALLALSAVSSARAAGVSVKEDDAPSGQVLPEDIFSVDEAEDEDKSQEPRSPEAAIPVEVPPADITQDIKSAAGASQPVLEGGSSWTEIKQGSFPVVEVGDQSPPPMPVMPEQAENLPGDVVPAPGDVFDPAGAQGVADDPVKSESYGKEKETFYDSYSSVPDANLAKTVGPRKLDPEKEPASSFVVVTGVHGKSDQETLMVSAERALSLGRYDAAVEIYDRLYSKNKRDKRIRMGRAVAYQKAGRAEQALIMYEELLSEDPDNAVAVLNMASLLKGQYPEVALRRLVELQGRYPENAKIAAQVGVAQSELGHHEDALRYLGVAESLEPDDPQHQFNMAIVMDRIGRKEDAIMFYEKALETDAVHGRTGTLPRDKIYERLSVLRQR